MSRKKKRAYFSEARQAMAAATREQILASSKKLFQSEGFDRVTIEQLAQAAKVSAPTIYSLFQSKRGLLLALMDEAYPSERFDELVEQVKQEKSPKKRLMIAAKMARQMYDSEKAEMELFRGATLLAPEFKEIEMEREERRYERQAETVRIMAKEKALAKGLSTEKARAILWAFTGRDLYRMFVINRGWSPAKYEKWLAEMLISTLLKN